MAKRESMERSRHRDDPHVGILNKICIIKNLKEQVEKVGNVSKEMGDFSKNITILIKNLLKIPEKMQYHK